MSTLHKGFQLGVCPIGPLVQDDHVALPVGTDDAYLKRDRRVAELMVNVTLPGNVSIDVGPYYAFDQKMSVVDKHANDLHTVELDDTVGAKFTIAWSL